MHCDEHGTLDYCPQCLDSEFESEQVNKLQAELDAAKAHIAEVGGWLTKVRSECRKRQSYGLPAESTFLFDIASGCNDHLNKLKDGKAQSLASIKAQAINDLISECSHSQPIDGIAWMVIDEDDARKFAAKIGGGE